jgi:hypothetical protein
MITGGCQCGAVRFRVEGELGRASICHCRMCQKAFGGFFGPLVGARRAQTTWTRGAPKYFQSSNKVRRGFCGDCGTPLTYEWSPETIELAIGAFDDPVPLKPVIQMARDAALPWTAELGALPGRSPQEREADELWRADLVSHQHPDHDTEAWPPKR